MQWSHHFRVSFIVLVSVILISAAVIFSVLRATLPYATGYKAEIQEEISRQIGLPVEIGSIDAAIHWFSPRLKLLDVSVLDENQKLHLFNFKEAFVELDVAASLLRGEIIVGDVGLVGTKISIEKLSHTDWLVQGVKFSSKGNSGLPEQFLYMLKNSDYLLHDSDIYYKDHTSDKLNLRLHNVNISVVNRFNTHNIKLSTNLPDNYGKNISVVANLSGDFDSLYGGIYVEANAIKVDQWNKKFEFLKAYQLNSVVDVAVWSTVQGNEISQLTTSFSADYFSIKNLVTNKAWSTNFLAADIDYVQGGKNRQLTISNFHFGDESRAEWGKSVNLLAGEDKKHYYFNADFLRLSDLHNIADVVLEGDSFDKVINEKYKKIKSYELQGDIYNLSLRLNKSEPVSPQTRELALVDIDVKTEMFSSQEEHDAKLLDTSSIQTVSNNASVSIKQIIDDLYVEATLYDFSMVDVSNKISVKGIDAITRYENNVANVSFFTDYAEIDFYKLFRAPLAADQIFGDISLVLKSAEKEVNSLGIHSWEINSEELKIKNQHINTTTRLNLQSEDGSPIKADIQTDFNNAAIKHTSKYLPVGIMRKSLVSWLDRTITNGHVPSGQFVLNGDLKDFPYRENNGVFQVLFSVNNFNMRYLEGWPVLSNTSAKLRFHGMSLDVTDIASTTQNASLFSSSAKIKNLSKAYVRVIANARGKNSDIQSFIWNSPLDSKLGDTMRLFELGGKSDLSLKIGIPLKSKNSSVSVDGRLVFDNAEIYYPELSYRMTQLNGVFDFTNDTVFSDSIEAYIQGRPVLLSANTFSKGNEKEMVFHLDGVIDADYLLHHYEWVPDNWLSGASSWSIDFKVPPNGSVSVLQVGASSSLENVAVNISDAVHKTVGDEVNLNAKINLLQNQKLIIDVEASDDVTDDVSNSHAGIDTKGVKQKILSLNAKLNKSKVWNIDIESAYLDGIAEFSSNLDKDSQITLDLNRINLSALFLTEGEGEPKKPLKPTDFPALDWRAKKVTWNDWSFSDAILKTNWNQYGMLINTLILKSTAFSFDGSGSWLISSGPPPLTSSTVLSRKSQETVLQGKITSNNIGDALTEFGYERSINRSSFDSKFKIKWPAEPYALSWSAIKGEASFDMKDGEILEVEPGTGGRLLGLMNIFKLTNRLAFDFDDVYRDGFSFDSITGAIELAGGQGSLKKFDITAPAADVNMFGSIGLVKQDFNLLMHVKPHTDTLTFYGGALVGGVAVGAGLALIQKIFDLGVIGHSVYSITGGWSDPVTEEVVEKAQSTSEDEDLDEL